MKKTLSALTLLFLIAASLPAQAPAPDHLSAAAAFEKARLQDVVAPALSERVRVRYDGNGIPHISAANNHDAYFVQGYLHAQDRFFQMDTLRRNFSGTAAELFGEAALAQDIQFRTLGLRRAAEASLAVLDDETIAILEAYSAGINAFLTNTPILPPEYGALELTSVAPWTPLDSVTVGKGLGFGLSFNLNDLDLTQALLTLQAGGAVVGFDGATLFSEDLYRTAPFDPAVSIPDFLAAKNIRETSVAAIPKKMPSYLDSRALNLVSQAVAEVGSTVPFAQALAGRDNFQGSNWWIADGSITPTGETMLANDPHLGLDTAPVFYEAQIRVRAGEDQPFSVTGVSFPGAPGIIQGCNPIACWGSTVHPMDVTDVYLEEIVFDPQSQLPVGTIFDGEIEPVVLIPQTYLFNLIGDQIADNLTIAPVDPAAGGLTIVVPRRNNGPILSIDLSDPTRPLGISIQYTGFGPTREFDATRRFPTVRSPEDFRDALQYFDVGSQNWSYADRNGNIAYFTSAEMPIREDLQFLGFPDGGVPPYLLRDGTHQLQHEWVPANDPPATQSSAFEILPFDEMPQVVNPASGYVLNCNNDPVGTSLDNNPLNQVRPGGGLYYLNPGYASGFRQGRIQRLFDAALADDGQVSMADFKTFQGNNQLLDAEALVPYLIDAFANAEDEDAPAELAAFAADERVKEAIARLDEWDYSTPTGIAQGYDPGDVPGTATEPSDEEIAASVAATIYSTWRGQVVQSVIDDSLATFGLDAVAPGSALAMTALRNLLDNFETNQGFGVSGFDFFSVQTITDREASRDFRLLEALAGALDLLSSETFGAAFGGSEDLNDYRWGYLHRIVFDHPLGGPFNIPNAGGVTDVSEDLPGVARAGGFGALDASSHSARADGVNEFMFGSGPARRFVGRLTADGPVADQVIPGGQSGVLGSPFQGDQLQLWLVNSYHPFLWIPREVFDSMLNDQRFLRAEP